ncbi:hypothetical protein F5Y16DRAFT_240954 [Xylariaceae sp. FL0255]|nr:hypothetical protein F5Y16DRAFT_240954 [Xylariaceae sp. FL0255]
MAVASPRPGLPGPGGFLPSATSLPSPAPSSASSRARALLPHPRSKPLLPGSKKEDYARDYIARRLLHVSRRYVKKHGIPDPADEVKGYESIDELCRDMDEIVDVLWFSGTPSIQVPYLLNVALAFNEYLPSFNPVPRPTFALLHKLDHCFASLLVGRDIKTKENLPGFSSSFSADIGVQPRFTKTDMVRCKSIADETRMIVAVVMSGEVDVVDFDDEDDGGGGGGTRVTKKRARAEEEDDEMDPANRCAARVSSISIQDCNDDRDDDHGFDSDSDFHLNFDSDPEARGVAPVSRLKRKPENIIAEDSTKSKRIKVEDDEVAEVDWSGIMPVDIPPIPMLPKHPEPATTNGEGQQFHWALDDDDDDSDSDSDPDPGHKGIPDNMSRSFDETAPIDVDPESIEFNGEDEPDDDDDESGGGAEDEDEDEEMQMNVAKVYVKTLVQLDLSMGTSIVDDD